MIKSARIALLGFGRMGQALAEGFLRNGISKDRIHAVDLCPNARTVAAEFGIDASETIRGLTRPPSVFILAVKPQHMADVLPLLQTRTAETTFFLSIAAGVPTTALQEVLGEDARIVRAMPNTPASVGAGMTVLCHSGNLAFQQLALAEALMGCVGACAWVEDEGLLHAVTAISGSGPAYFYLMMEVLEEIGIKHGIPPKLARALAVQTCRGTGMLAAERVKEPIKDLRQRVVSPGGTTEAALQILEKPAFSKMLAEAVHAAAERSKKIEEGG